MTNKSDHRRPALNDSTVGDAAAGAGIVTAIIGVAALVYLEVWNWGDAFMLALGLTVFGMIAVGFFGVVFLIILAMTGASRAIGPRNSAWQTDPWAEDANRKS